MTLVVEVSDLFFVDNVAVSCLKSETCSVLNKSKALETELFAFVCSDAALIVNISKRVEVSKTCSLESCVCVYLCDSCFLNLAEEIEGNRNDTCIDSYVESCVIISILDTFKACGSSE